MKKGLHRCSACFAVNDPKNLPIPGDGPMGSKVLFVGEGPGKMEANIGRPFVGKTGEELNNTYLPLAGCSRYDVRCTNTFRCKYADSSDTPNPDVISTCAKTHLAPELEEVNPDIVVLMGGIANGLIGLDIDTIHGTGRTATIFNWTGKVFSTYHPALGLHKSSAMQSLLDDFRTLKGFIRGDIGFLEDEIPQPRYFRLTTGAEVESVLDGWWDEPIAIDTESRKTWRGYRPTIRYIGWCLTFCITPGEAFMIRVVDTQAIKRFAQLIRKFRKVLLHNAPHDMKVLERMGISIEWDKVVDTMSMAYNEARLPKGLKPLAYQLLGAKTRSFEDVVRPYGLKAAMEFVERMSWEEWKEPEQEWTGEMVEKNCQTCKGKGICGKGRGKKRKTWVCKECGGRKKLVVKKMTRKQGIGQKVGRLITDYLKNPQMDVWSRWEGWGDAVEEVIERMGPLPLDSVELVPEGEILDYAGADAHNTKRIYPVLLRRLVDIRRSYASS